MRKHLIMQRAKLVGHRAHSFTHLVLLIHANSVSKRGLHLVLETPSVRGQPCLPSQYSGSPEQAGRLLYSCLWPCGTLPSELPFTEHCACQSCWGRSVDDPDPQDTHTSPVRKFLVRPGSQGWYLKHQNWSKSKRNSLNQLNKYVLSARYSISHLAERKHFYPFPSSYLVLVIPLLSPHANILDPTAQASLHFWVSPPDIAWLLCLQDSTPSPQPMPASLGPREDSISPSKVMDWPYQGGVVV